MSNEPGLSHHLQKVNATLKITDLNRGYLSGTAPVWQLRGPELTPGTKSKQKIHIGLIHGSTFRNNSRCLPISPQSSSKSENHARQADITLMEVEERCSAPSPRAHTQVCRDAWAVSVRNRARSVVFGQFRAPRAQRAQSCRHLPNPGGGDPRRDE